MTASMPLGGVRHPLAPYDWRMDPLVLIEDSPDGPYLMPLAELAPAC